MKILGKGSSLQVEYINKGTGNRVGDTIYLNKNLLGYPDLHDAIKLHEKNHTGGFTWADLSLDLSNKELKNLKKQYYKFILKNPRALLNFLPVMKIKNMWTYDISLIGLWLFAILIGVMVWILI